MIRLQLVRLTVVSLPLLLLLLRITVLAFTYEPRTLLLETGDQCDWTGSGGGGQGVRPIYLRCSRGTISWRYPRGALRVVLSPPILVDCKLKVCSEFRACTKVSGPVRVYLETNGKLRSVYSPRDGKREASHRCFYAKKQPAALYVEAEEPWFVDSQVAKLQYDIEVRRREEESVKVNKDEDDDCRPCSMEELAKAFCQSDLVARGTISAVQKRPDLEAAELIVGITKTLRRIDDENDVVPDTDTVDRSNIVVRVPTACDARHGQGEFVIMAKRRLGDLVLVCAPRLETWAKTVRELSSTPPCVLRS